MRRLILSGEACIPWLAAHDLFAGTFVVHRSSLAIPLSLCPSGFFSLYHRCCLWAAFSRLSFQTSLTTSRCSILSFFLFSLASASDMPLLSLRKAQHHRAISEFGYVPACKIVSRLGVLRVVDASSRLWRGWSYVGANASVPVYEEPHSARVVSPAATGNGHMLHPVQSMFGLIGLGSEHHCSVVAFSFVAALFFSRRAIGCDSVPLMIMCLCPCLISLR